MEEDSDSDLESDEEKRDGYETDDSQKPHFHTDSEAEESDHEPEQLPSSALSRTGRPIRNSRNPAFREARQSIRHLEE